MLIHVHFIAFCNQTCSLPTFYLHNNLGTCLLLFNIRRVSRYLWAMGVLTIKIYYIRSAA